MHSLARLFEELARELPPDRQPAVLAIGVSLERLFAEQFARMAEIEHNQTELRDTLGPLLYDQAQLYLTPIRLELSAYAARLADAELRGLAAQQERAALRRGVDDAQQEQAEIRDMIGALAEDMATLRAHVERCCGPIGGAARAVGDG